MDKIKPPEGGYFLSVCRGQSGVQTGVNRHAPQNNDEAQAGVLRGRTCILGTFGERVDFERGVINRRFQRGVEQFDHKRDAGGENQQHFVGEREGQEDKQKEEGAVQAKQFAEARFFDGGLDAVNRIAEGFEDAADAAFAAFELFGIGGWRFRHGCRFQAMGKEKPAGSGFGRQRCDQAAALTLALRRLFRRAALFL